MAAPARTLTPTWSARRFGLALLCSACAFALAACAAPQAGDKSVGGMQGSSGASATMMSDENAPNPDTQTCASCGGKDPAPATTGTVEERGGVQIIKVLIKDGSYTPNRFIAKADKPITVVFRVEGKPAAGCLSEPTFGKLKKTVTITTGETRVDLGVLAPGTYEFGCSMGMNASSIVVQ